MPASDPLGPLPQRRVVLLGASNLARGMSTVIATAGRVWNQPVEVLAALGHGRSYGCCSRLCTRQLPGIVECGLWRALEQESSRPTAALVTDIGNDLLYGQGVERTFGWVAACVERLERAGARIALTGLPLESVERLSPWKFQLLRRVLFPRNRLTRDEVLEQARQLDARLKALARQRNLVWLVPEGSWYGWDPIHLRMRVWPEAWQQMLLALNERSEPDDLPETARGSLRRWVYLRLLVPEQRRLLGISQRCRQPAGRLPDGTTVALY